MRRPIAIGVAREQFTDQQVRMSHMHWRVNNFVNSRTRSHTKTARMQD